MTSCPFSSRHLASHRTFHSSELVPIDVQQCERAVNFFCFIATRVRLDLIQTQLPLPTMEPVTSVTTMAPARPQKSSHKRPLTKEQEAKRAALERNYDIKRRFVPEQNQIPLQIGAVPPVVTPTLHRPAVKEGGESVRGTRNTTIYEPQLQVPNILSKAEHTAPVSKAPIDSPRGQQKLPRQYQGSAKGDFVIIRDIYQVPHDEEPDGNICSCL